jgi:acyl-CoA thioesterase-1
MPGDPLFQSGDVVLFQGDSITDCGRDRSDPASLGGGYAAAAAAWFAAAHPDRRVTFLNRGVSGDRVRDLEARWRADCLALEPAWVSVLIGINDVWRRYDSGEITPVDEFAGGYRRILRAAAGAGARLILLEPFVLHVAPDRAAWREDLDPKIEAVRGLAREFGAILIPLDRMFAAASRKRPPAFWAEDGVHPSPAGHALIARAWLEAVGGL